MKNTMNGYTLAELVITVGISSLALLILAGVRYELFSQQLKLGRNLEQSIDKATADTIMYRDFSQMQPSFGNLNKKDDNDKSFFSYYPDLPNGSNQPGLSRIFSLSSKSTSKTFELLLENHGAGETLVYDPTAAYEIGDAPDNFNTPATLTFKGLDYKSWVSVQRPHFFDEGNLLLLDTAASLRPLDAQGNLNMQTEPRSPAFLGLTSGASLSSLDSIKDTQGLFNYISPKTGTALTSVDKFLRNAPSVGGGLPIFKLRAVRFVRYHIEPAENSPTDCGPQKPGSSYVHGNLYRETFSEKGFGGSFLIADNVCRVVVERKTVLNRLVTFKIIKTSNLESKEDI